MKSILKKLLPLSVYNFVRERARYNRLKKSFDYDLNHYFKYSMNLDDNSEGKLISRIILDTHVIEKGLTMPDTKLGFGSVRLNILMDNVSLFVQRYNIHNPQLLHAYSVLVEYFNFHKQEGFDLKATDVVKYENLLALKASKQINVTQRNQIETTSTDYFSKLNGSFKEFSESRSSLRNYDSQLVPIEMLESALDLARNTPSACNRQSVRVHLYTNKDKISKILDIQGGNRGFGHLANFLIAVTFKPKIYFEQNERNSGHVDGGMYCMNILYALHTQKLAACILNAAHAPEKDIKMRQVANVPEDEVFVAFIAGGYAPKTFKIARSFRYPLNHILTKH
jgi:nitroreductase